MPCLPPCILLLLSIPLLTTLLITTAYLTSHQLQTFATTYSLAHPRLTGIIPFVTPESTHGITVEDIPSQHGKVVVITGANSGLGFSAAKILASKGATLVLACRSTAKCATAVDTIQALHPTANIQPLHLDLSSLHSVQSFAHEVQQQYPLGLDTLMLNAGVMRCPYTLTEDRIEAQFAINHVGHQ